MERIRCAANAQFNPYTAPLLVLQSRPKLTSCQLTLVSASCQGRAESLHFRFAVTHAIAEWMPKRRAIARRSHDTAVARAPDSDWLAPQFGIALLDRRVERVHIDVDDLYVDGRAGPPWISSGEPRLVGPSSGWL